MKPGSECSIRRYTSCPRVITTCVIPVRSGSAVADGVSAYITVRGIGDMATTALTGAGTVVGMIRGTTRGITRRTDGEVIGVGIARITPDIGIVRLYTIRPSEEEVTTMAADLHTGIHTALTLLATNSPTEIPAAARAYHAPVRLHQALRDLTVRAAQAELTGTPQRLRAIPEHPQAAIAIPAPVRRVTGTPEPRVLRQARDRGIQEPHRAAIAIRGAVRRAAGIREPQAAGRVHQAVRATTQIAHRAVRVLVLTATREAVHLRAAGTPAHQAAVQAHRAVRATIQIAHRAVRVQALTAIRAAHRAAVHRRAAVPEVREVHLQAVLRREVRAAAVRGEGNNRMNDLQGTTRC